MCLIVKKGTKPKIAEKDIICYKVLSCGTLLAKYQGFEYQLNTLYSTVFSKISCYPYWGGWSFCDDVDFIHYNQLRYESEKTCGRYEAYQQGFHSFSSIERRSAGKHMGDTYECTIPKGTLYIEDETGLICSEAIIINKILE